MGGTFDPIHHGHLVVAEEAYWALELERVIFIPTGNSFHKSERRISSAEDRYMMTCLATLENEHFRVSRVEIDRHEPSYTVETLREMRHWFSQGEAKFFFITGIDAVLTILDWHERDALPDLCTIVAVNRPGFDDRAGLDAIQDLPAPLRKVVFPLTVPSLSISSTDVRRRAAEGKNIRYLVPPLVERYILKRRLYQEGNHGGIVRKG